MKMDGKENEEEDVEAKGEKGDCEREVKGREDEEKKMIEKSEGERTMNFVWHRIIAKEIISYFLFEHTHKHLLIRFFFLL